MVSHCPIVCIFLTAFLPQIPIVHTPTLRVELKPPMIVRAMQACGAIFVKTPVAQAFVEKMLAKSRDMVHEFVRAHLQLVSDSTFSLIFIQAKPSPEPRHQVHVIMTLLLLQTIGLFHQDPQQRASSNIYHGMLVLVRSLFVFCPKGSPLVRWFDKTASSSIPLLGSPRHFHQMALTAWKQRGEIGLCTNPLNGI